MHDYRLNHLSDDRLLQNLAVLVRQERAKTVEVLAHIAEVDERRLYAPAGYASMHAYCVGKLRLSEDAAFKRIRAARAGQRFPLLFQALAEGRIHLAAAYLLAPYLTAENVRELLESVTHRRKSEVEALLSNRFQAPVVITSVRPVTVISRPRPKSGEPDVRSPGLQLGLGPGGTSPDWTSGERHSGREAADSGAPTDARELAPGPVVETAKVETPPAERYLLRVLMEKGLHDKLRRVQAMLSHAVPSGDVAQLLDRAFDALIEQQERRKLGSGARKSMPRPAISRSRYIPAHVRRAVWKRDQGQCTFIGSTGHRCGTQKFLQLDHVEPYARNRTATVSGLRLRCRAHNQLEAERAFGTEFMKRKREMARSGLTRSADRGLPSGPKAPRSG